MMTKNQALNLEQGVRVKYGREIFTVDHRTDVGTHEEPVLVAESGRRLVGTLFIAHLLSFADKHQADHGETNSEPMDAGDDYSDTDDEVGTHDAAHVGFAYQTSAVSQVDQSEDNQSPKPESQSISLELHITDTPVIAELEVAPAPTLQGQELPVSEGIPAEELALLEAFEVDAAI